MQEHDENTALVREELRTVQRLGEVLSARKILLATAESCTGGAVASRLTDAAGSSQWFAGGIVAYANEVKTALLQVPEADIAVHGAVSEAVVKGMAQGVCRVLPAAVSVAVSGIAGPDGGTQEKPVGTVWIAWCIAGRCTARLYHFEGSRAAIKEATVGTALNQLLGQLS